MRIILTADEAHKYRLRPDELDEINEAPPFHERYIRPDERRNLYAILDKYQVPDEHRNYLTWFYASLILTLGNNEISKSWAQFYECISFSQYATKQTPYRITLRINEKELHLTHNERMINSLFETLKPWLIENANRFPELPERSKGRPKGKQNPGKEASLHNLAENLIQVIGMNKEDARELVYNIGLLVGLWQDKGEKRKRTYEYFKRF